VGGAGSPSAIFALPTAISFQAFGLRNWRGKTKLNIRVAAWSA
jgi:hypothetical protein